MTHITCPFACGKRSHCELTPCGEARLDQVGGYVEATRYAASECPLEVEVTIRTGSSVLDPNAVRRIA